MYVRLCSWGLRLKQGENHGTTMILEGVSYSAFIHSCRVILSRIMNPTVVSLQPDLLLVFNLSLSGLDVCLCLVLTSLGVY